MKLGFLGEVCRLPSYLNAEQCDLVNFKSQAGWAWEATLCPKAAPRVHWSQQRPKISRAAFQTASTSIVGRLKKYVTWASVSPYIVMPRSGSATYLSSRVNKLLASQNPRVAALEGSKPPRILNHYCQGKDIEDSNIKVTATQIAAFVGLSLPSASNWKSHVCFQGIASLNFRRTRCRNCGISFTNLPGKFKSSNSLLEAASHQF